MKKIVTCWVLIIGLTLTANADHITGGEMFYTLTNYSNGVYNYHVTTKLFMDCYSNRRLPDPAVFGIFDKTTGNRVKDISVGMTTQQGLELTNPGPCITNPPKVCYQIGYYDFDVPLPPSPLGYIIVIQVVYRVKGISNLTPEYGNIGATYSCEIPGTSSIATAPQNNSAKFAGDDMVVICANNSFSYSFAAKDPDKEDVLRYTFCNALIGGSGGGGTNSSPQPPPYQSVPYGNDYGPTQPLGSAVHIDPATGMITGIAPDEGIYVVTVCVDEIRDSKVIATQRKDLQIRITSCTIASASIPPDLMLCKDTKTISLSNLSTSPLITSTNWEIFDAGGASIFSSSSTTDNYTFNDIGTYKVKLVINRDKQCSDSASSTVRVYPGFVPSFNFNGICFNKQTQFTDASTSRYGIVSSWKWDFGDFSSTGTSLLQNPVHTYASMGSKHVRLIATDTKGCKDTTFKDVVIVDKPPITLAFRDTLICVPDPVTLKASGGGIFSWAGISIVNPNTPAPIVSPVATSMYYVTLNDNGCVNRDSVKVRVVDHVTLQAMQDTIICQGDTVRLHLQSNGLQYSWTPAAQVINPLAANPFVITGAPTPYQVVARIGSCTARDEVRVQTIPYPVVNAGPDTTICFNSLAQLKGSTNGSSFNWLSSPTLNNPNVLNPYATPRDPATPYILSATDTKGCPKPAFDTAFVYMLPDISTFAGRDTSVIVGQQLKLHVSGGIRYEWSPAIGLSNTHSADPIAVYHDPSAGIQYKVMAYNSAGCADSAFVKVKVYQTAPTVFVPNAFTPNSDRKNDVLRPLAVGIAKIDYFQVFNRWGQMVFTTNINEHGWDGTVGGRPQPAGAYVWVVKATDFTGSPYVQRGTVLLIK